MDKFKYSFVISGLVRHNDLVYAEITHLFSFSLACISQCRATSAMNLPLAAVHRDHRKKLVSSKLQFDLKVYLRDLL